MSEIEKGVQVNPKETKDKSIFTRRDVLMNIGLAAIGSYAAFHQLYVVEKRPYPGWKWNKKGAENVQGVSG